MNQSEREDFWKILCSLPGKDIVAEHEQLSKGNLEKSAHPSFLTILCIF